MFFIWFFQGFHEGFPRASEACPFGIFFASLPEDMQALPKMFNGFSMFCLLVFSFLFSVNNVFVFVFTVYYVFSMNLLFYCIYIYTLSNQTL